ncbi:hypothetical protein [Desulfovibrio sp. JC010]|uniref:hypothetical protein n=1 Tax=Desulfovibrio sp. JC010 TaxID=2593641 RepID=UPI00193FA38B|nr:hypothetical protein [Desulfovibrio sp. JC010]
MDNLPSLKKFGQQLDLLKRLLKEGREEQADFIAQEIYENYAYARDGCLSQEDELLGKRADAAEKDERIGVLEAKLKEVYSVHSSDFQLFSKFGKALQHVNDLKSLNGLQEMLQGIATELDLDRVAVVLDRELCGGELGDEIPTFYMKGCMRYIDATLSDGPNRVFLGPIARMMRPDVFFGDPDMSPDIGGSCFAFGLRDKYNPGKLIGLFAIHDASEDRFHPEMGTDFLEYFCNSIASTLLGVLNRECGF